MANDPQQIAERLIQQYGSPEAAMITAIEGTTEAHSTSDLYALSVWREIKRVLREKTAA